MRSSGGHLKQRQLLESEGVVFNEKERVDLNRFSWSGPSDDWLSERGLK
jgi:alkylated DNA nucleotide flippase Atl1